MAKMGTRVPDDATLAQVLDFLHEHARDGDERHEAHDH
jgi:hypothetical protein